MKCLKGIGMEKDFKLDVTLREYISEPLSKCFLNELRAELDNLSSKQERFRRPFRASISVVIISFSIALLIVSSNDIQFNSESSTMQTYVVAHLVILFVMFVIWGVESDFFIPSENKLSIKIEGIERLRVPAMNGGMLEQIGEVEVEGNYLSCPDALLLIENIKRQDRKVVLFEARLLKRLMNEHSRIKVNAVQT
ncbi:MAG: hypothetical protein C9356_20290 [Oleiphilus sp.]|nr:MAG: hypothetical protein C9356_20290 [Oleiphilus sp.]